MRPPTRAPRPARPPLCRRRGARRSACVGSEATTEAIFSASSRRRAIRVVHAIMRALVQAVEVRKVGAAAEP